MRPVVWIGVVCVHILDGSKNSVRVERVVVLPDVVLHHRVEELPADVVGRSQALVVVCKRKVHLKIVKCQIRGLLPSKKGEPISSNFLCFATIILILGPVSK